tara:strand:+ start:1696 stop:2283 length:588 start_codon:yes stop_codon:yes gene_type:complete
MDENKIIGVDEVGRGCLAGPVVAAAIILNIKDLNNKEIKDSKLLSFKQRKNMFNILKKNSVFRFGIVSEKKIDDINILNASLLAMKIAVSKIDNYKKYKILVDGPMSFDKKNLNIEPIINGDNLNTSISAASIMAKYYRDCLMIRLARKFPQYMWEKNFGYGTKDHIKNISKYGICKHHRKSFKPIHNILSKKKI